MGQVYNLEFPPLGDELDDKDPVVANKIIEYQRAACNKEDPMRLQKFWEAEEIRFLYGSKPWMMVPNGGDPRNPFLEPIRTEDSKIRLASRNEMAPILDGAVSRLIGSTGEPSVRPTKATTVVHRAAKKSEEVLDDELKRVGWLETQHKDALNAVHYGTGWLLAGWETDLEDQRPAPAEVHACDNPVCGVDPTTQTRKPWVINATGGEEIEGVGHRFTGDVAQEMMAAGVGISIDQPLKETKSVTLAECPECGGSLSKRRALPEDGEMDAFGYELTEDQPLPKFFVHGFPDLDVFPIGHGRSVHGFMGEVTIETIVELSWLMQRYKHADEVEGASLGEMEELARWHPSGLEMWGYAGHTLSNDQKRWAPYRITIRQPFRHKDPEKSEPLGRLMITAGKTILFNGPLLFEYQTYEGKKKLIPRMKLFPFANIQQNNTVNGISDSSRLVNPQRSLDAIYTQFQFDMATNGSPDMLWPIGANYDGQGDGYEENDSENDGLPNRIVRYNPDIGKPEWQEGKVTHADWKPFLEFTVEHMQRTSAQSQLDRGAAVSGAPSATAQITIGQRLDETRKPKGQRWAERLSAVFSYGLEVICAVYTDRRQFFGTGSADNQTIRDFSAADLMGQTVVEVAVRPAHDNEAFQRQNMIEAIQMQAGIVDLSTPRQRLKVAEALGLKDELDAEPNQQIKNAEDENLDYTLGNPPKKMVAKKRTDDHQLHPQTHMEFLRSASGQAMLRMQNDHERATFGWYDEFKKLMETEARLKAAPAPDPVVPMDPNTNTPDAAAAKAQAAAKAADDMALAQIAGLPKNTQDRIEKIQMGMVEAYLKENPLPEEDVQDLMELTFFLCHVEAHQYYALEQAQQQLAAQQISVAPNPTTPAAAPSGTAAPPSAV